MAQGTGDSLQPAYPNNTHKQDWIYTPFVGGRGAGGPLTTPPTTRYSFWIDFDPFDIKNLKMLSQNVTFQIFSDNLGSNPLIPYFIVDQSNDITDELIEANLPTTPGGSLGTGTATINYPPVGYSDSNNGSNFSGVPPTSSALAAPTGVTAALSALGNLGFPITYYYCITWVNGSGTESLPSAVVSATTTSGDQTIGIGFTPVAGASYYLIYRNTINNFTTGNGAIQVSTYYAGQPPYYINTVFTSQPTSTNFRNDQGSYTLAGNQGFGFGFGNNTMVAQGFVPQQSQLTGIFLGQLFHTNTNDPTTFYQLNFELWSSSNTFIQHLGSLQPTFNPANGANGLTTDASCTAVCNHISYNTATDGNNYWITLNQPTLKFTNPVSVTPGTTYYIVVRQQTASASAFYFLGTNANSISVRDALHYYPFAGAYTATDGSSTWSHLVDANGKAVTFPFLTQGNVGRYAVTYWWANLGTVYWNGTPSSKEFAFLHVDYNTRI